MAVCSCVTRIFERQGYRELAAAHLFAQGVPLAPTLDDKQMLARHALDELGHFELVAAALDELGQSDLLGRVAPDVAKLPAPKSWVEMALIGVSFDRAVYFQLRAHASAPDRRVAELAVRVTADEQEHLAAAQAALTDLAQREKAFASQLVAGVERWLPLALDCFESPAVESADCIARPHISFEATEKARRAYLASLSELLVPFGVPAADFSR